jgi:nicotinamide-nucleotide amidase
MQSLLPIAAEIGEILKTRKETIAIAESSTGGLISASLLALPGASAYYLGGSVIYTRQARTALTSITDDQMRKVVRAATEPYATLLAKQAREGLGATWAISETGATGPSGNRYGDAAGHSCMAVSGPVDAVITLETGSRDRQANMRAFALRALELFKETLAKAR